jgi:hypothetical protein
MVCYNKSYEVIPDRITNHSSQTCSGPSRTSSTSESPLTVAPVNLGVSHTPISLTLTALSRPRQSWRRRASTAASSESTTLVNRAADPRATGLTVVGDTRVTTTGPTAAAGSSRASVTMTLADSRGVAATRSPSEESKLRRSGHQIALFIRLQKMHWTVLEKAVEHGTTATRIAIKILVAECRIGRGLPKPMDVFSWVWRSVK